MGSPSLHRRESRLIIFLKLPKRIWIIISLLALFSLLFFSYLTFYKFDSTFSTSNIFSQYYKFEWQFFKGQRVSFPFLFFIFFLVTCAAYVEGSKIKMGLSVFLKSALLGLFAIFLSFNLSFIAVWLLAFAQINLTAMEMKLNPKMVGLLANTDQIADNLKSANATPKIIETTFDNLGKQIIRTRIEQGPAGSFYNFDIVNSVPNYLIFKIQLPKRGVVMLGNILFFPELNIDDLQKLSPQLGFLLIKQEMGPRYIKNPPVISVLGRQDYLKMRDDQINTHLKAIDTVLGEVDNEIATTNQNIYIDNSKIQANKNGLAESIDWKNKEYANCISAGYYSYFTGTFYYYYDAGYCSSKASLDWDNLISGFQKNIGDWEASLNGDRKYLSELKDLRQIVAGYRVVIASQKDTTPFELGIFREPNKVDIALDWINAKSIYAYLETLSHEYLHYTTYVSNERYLPRFFEEGLTEYYARRTVKDILKKNINLGYPLVEKVIDEMLKKLPEKELQDIYFSKDTNSLSGLLDKIYGDKFYENNALSFEILPLLPGKDGLKLANEIMKQIGGNEIKESDLETLIN